MEEDENNQIGFDRKTSVTKLPDISQEEDEIGESEPESEEGEVVYVNEIIFKSKEPTKEEKTDLTPWEISTPRDM